jgi:NACalpha-BTF3-like transcription factor
MIGDMMIASEKMTKDMIKGMEDTIRIAEENLSKPDLNAEMKTIYEEQIKSAKTSIEESQKPDDTSDLNAEDLALVAKYKAQIDEATKKYQTKPGN